MKKALLYVMAIAYVFAGINHFWHPQMYLKIIPHFLPMQEAINIISGVLEVVIGVLLVPMRTRNLAAWSLVVLLVLIFPANIQMALDYTKEGHPQKWISYLRLPLQIPLIWWALAYTDWYHKKKVKRESYSAS